MGGSGNISTSSTRTGTRLEPAHHARSKALYCATQHTTLVLSVHNTDVWLSGPYAPKSVPAGGADRCRMAYRRGAIWWWPPWLEGTRSPRRGEQQRLQRRPWGCPSWRFRALDATILLLLLSLFATSAACLCCCLCCCVFWCSCCCVCFWLESCGCYFGLKGFNCPSPSSPHLLA